MLGGGWAFEYAYTNPKLKAAYSFYGNAVDNADDAKKVACPVYGFYAENDERVDATIPKAEELMKAAGKNMSRSFTKAPVTDSCAQASRIIQMFAKATKKRATKHGRAGRCC